VYWVALFSYDYSRKVWIYLLKSKGNPFDTFKELKVRTEYKTNRRIKNLRNDNGLELCREFYKLTELQSIKKQPSTKLFCSDNDQ
jgi:hypothetical protein